MNSSKKVAIILCTYNGEKYIAEQIDSILNQSYPCIDIYVQDDRSTDSTLAVLKKYSDSGAITLYESDSNLGYPFAFYDLLSKVNDYDYYAFSDQDDVWNKDKIERAVNLLFQSNPTQPAIAFSNYHVCDEELHILRTSVGPNRKPDFLYSIYSSLGLGFTYVINDAGKKFITTHRSKRNVTKDVWIGMCCTAFGEAFFDEKPSALHRRNSGAYSAQDRNFVQIQKARFERFFKNDGLETVYDVIKEFRDMFYSELTKDKQNTIDFFLAKQYPHQFKKVFYPKRLRYDLKDDIMLRFVFLFKML